jgi:thymidylate synthase (FAD)
METKIISMTQPLIEGVSTPEELVVYTARVSNPENQLNMETADRLLNYLIKHKHWSPFEMVDITVEIKTSRAIAAQILRHRSFSFQEFSQRYSEIQDFELVELRRSGATNRQSSMEVFNPTIHNVSANKMVKNHIAEGQRLYNNLLANGVAKECARMVLPLTVGTTLYMKGSLRSWLHYLQIRCDEHTQLEHREIALNILELFRDEFPNVIKAISL